ncbi:MAG: hypothetical protein IMY70_03040 [Bacteroidetes bacterium]|nr:hypothetical protein [Bacteroidota bacterium]
MKDQTIITMYVPEKDKVGLIISDMLGRKVIRTERVLDRGYHSFKFTPGGGKIFFFTAYWQGTSSSIKILHVAPLIEHFSSIEYLGSYKTEPQLKSENGWYGNGNGIDSHGFTGLPGGYRCLTGGLSRIGEFAYFLSSTDSSSWGAFYRLLFRNDAIVLRGINNRYKSLCVHCVRNGLLPVVSCY